MVIPIEKIGEVVAETFRQIKTGVSTVRNEGVAIVELPDSKFGANGVQFSMTVVATGGLNAVDRKTTQSQDTETITEQIEHSYFAERSEESTKNSGGATTTETGDQTTTQTGGSGVSGSNTVTTTYEYE